MYVGADVISFGIYACSPEESSFTDVFSDMKITECAWKAHNGQQPDELRTQFTAVTPAYHWNKKHWSDVYYEQLDDSQVMEWIKESYQLVASKLPKTIRQKYI